MTEDISVTCNTHHGKRRGRSDHKMLRSVEVAKRTERDNWELADAIRADLHDANPNLAAARFGPGVSTGLTDAEKALHEEMAAAGVVDIRQSYLHDLYVTSVAWPEDDRVPGASFRSHYLLRSQTYDHGKRRAILERLAAKSKSGRVGQLDVQVWISEHRPRQSYTFLQLVERRIRGSVKGAASPWHLVAEDDRQQIATILHRIAAEVAEGTFPPKAGK